MARTKNIADTVTSKRIRDLRKAQKLTQADLAEKIGVTDQTIRKYESGRYGVPASSILAIASTLGCCPEYLMDATDCITQEEYIAREKEIQKMGEFYQKYHETRERQERITEEMLSEFLGYTAKKKEVMVPIAPGSRGYECKFVYVLTTPENKQVKFESSGEWENFILNFYDDVKKVLKYHIYEYIDAEKNEKEEKNTRQN